MQTEDLLIDTCNESALRESGITLRKKFIEVGVHMQFALFEADSVRQFTLQHFFDNPRPRVGFNFCIEGRTSFGLSGGYPTAFADNRRVNNFFMPVCRVTQGLELTPLLSLATLYVDAEAFLRMIDERLEELPRKLLDVAHVDNRCYFESYAWQPVIRTVLSQVLRAQMSPLAGRIFIESKALELIAIILDIFTRDTKPVGVSKSDIEKIQFAKEILLKDIANPPTLTQLARAAGTNEFTLKRGFKQIFNVPVFKYLQQMRLTRAYELFQSTNLPVSEVALIVGYESVSSFTRAFIDFYGIKPGDVKRIPFRTI